MNLAVLNSLPIPLLDGGQFLFLAAEKVRGTPAPRTGLELPEVAGLIFVVALILFINGNDLYNVVKSYLRDEPGDPKQKSPSPNPNGPARGVSVDFSE